MTAEDQTTIRRHRPRWRIRRPILSVLLSCLLAATLLWASLLVPRTFVATGTWSGNSDPLLAQIDHPPLHQLAANLLKQRDANDPAITLSPLPGQVPGLCVTARAASAVMAVDRVDEWLAQRAIQLTGQLQQQLTDLKDQQQTFITEQQSKYNALDEQIQAAQALMTVANLPTHEVLAVQLAQAQRKLSDLTAEQAVYLGANRTLKGLQSRKQLLEQDLAMHQQRYGRSDDDPAVLLVKDQLEKLNVRIKVISEASRLDEQADAKLAKVSGEIDATQQDITRLRSLQLQRVEQTQAAKVLGDLVPQRQALGNVIDYHQHQLNLINEALTGKVAWGHIQQASPSQTLVIWPTFGHIALLAILGAMLCWGLLQVFFRWADRTLDHGMLLDECLALPVLGQVIFPRRVSVFSWLCRLTVYPVATVCVLVLLGASLAAAYVNLQAPQSHAGLWQMFTSPVEVQRIWYRQFLPPAPIPRTLPVVIELPSRQIDQLSDKSS